MARAVNDGGNRRERTALLRANLALVGEKASRSVDSQPYDERRR
jgi:hypothetical protein